MIDLHSHSTFSDGSESPEHVVELAAEAGCSTVALTDHDTTEGLGRAARRAAELGIGLIRGCEVSCAFSPGTLHMLCYFIGDGPNPLENELERLRTDRSRRNALMAERLEAIGLPITYDEVMEEAGGTGVGRPHFAAVLMRKGVVSSVQEAFDRYLAKGTPGYVSKARIGAERVIELVRRSGGVSVVAHPLLLALEPDPMRVELRRLVELGLGGMECYYARYEPEVRAQLAETARALGLVPTGGTDFHGSYKPDLSMGTGRGDLEVPDDVVAELGARRP
jgi:predicted metal-dependent phosphoesterase TrpH